MDLELAGKRAVVTGGSRGIGLAVARALADEGCDVALVARDADALKAARGVVAAVADGLGGDDILVNSAARPNTGAVVGIDGFDAAEFAD